MARVFALTTRAASAASATALFARAGFGHGNVPSTHIPTAETGDGRLRGFGGFHRDERESTRTTRFPVGDDVHFGDVAELLEQVLEFVFSGLEGKIPDKQFTIHIDDVSQIALALSRCSRLSGFKSSLNDVQLKIHQAFERTNK